MSGLILGDQPPFTIEEYGITYVISIPRVLNACVARPMSFHPLRVNKLYLVAGVLACLDGYMNIALEQTEEYVNGQLKNKYGDAFIRGNNVLYISTQKRRV